jgi:hypothetical protein
MIHKAEQILDSHIRSFAPLEKAKKFHASPDYPKAAWYEAIVNATEIERDSKLDSRRFF